MATFDERIEGFVCGDHLTVQRAINGLPPGQTIAKAWFAVKRTALDADGDALVMKVVTTTTGPAGVISDPGTNGVAIVEFYLLPEDTDKLTKSFPFELQVKLSDDTLSTPLQGSIVGRQPLVQASN